MRDVGEKGFALDVGITGRKLLYLDFSVTIMLTDKKKKIHIGGGYTTRNKLTFFIKKI